MKYIGITRIVALIMVVCLVCFVGQCEGKEVTNNKRTKMIVDQMGRKVELPAEINRIVTLPIPMPSIIYAVDGTGEKIVGMHPKSMTAVKDSTLNILAPELKEVSTNFVESGFVVNIEELLKLEPDLVFQWAHQEKEIKKMENAGLTVIGVKYGTQDDLEVWMEMLGKIFEKEDRVEKIIQYHRETINSIVSKLKNIKEKEKPRVFYLASEKPGTAGEETFNNYWMEVTGAINVANNISGWGNIVNMEQVLGWNPEIIYIGNFCDLQPEDLLKNRVEGQDWSNIDAVKNGRVYKIPIGGYRWDPPNVETPLMLKWLAQIQYSDIFDDYEMSEEIKSFYKRFHDYELSDEMINEILKVK